MRIQVSVQEGTKQAHQNLRLNELRCPTSKLRIEHLLKLAYAPTQAGCTSPTLLTGHGTSALERPTRRLEARA